MPFLLLGDGELVRVSREGIRKGSCCCWIVIVGRVGVKESTD